MKSGAKYSKYSKHVCIHIYVTVYMCIHVSMCLWVWYVHNVCDWCKICVHINMHIKYNMDIAFICVSVCLIYLESFQKQTGWEKYFMLKPKNDSNGRPKTV